MLATLPAMPLLMGNLKIIIRKQMVCPDCCHLRQRAEIAFNSFKCYYDEKKKIISSRFSSLASKCFAVTSRGRLFVLNPLFSFNGHQLLQLSTILSEEKVTSFTHSL